MDVIDDTRPGNGVSIWGIRRWSARPRIGRPRETRGISSQNVLFARLRDCFPASPWSRRR